MSTIDFIDLSLVKNQNKLAKKIANFFTKDELNYIDLSKLEPDDRDLGDIQYIYYSKTFENKKSLKIIDTLILDRYPAIRYVTIRLSIGDEEQLDYKCKYTKNIINILNVLFARIYNYKFWGNDEDHIIKSRIMAEYANKLRSKLTNEDLEEVKFVLTYLINDGSIKRDNEFNYNFGIGPHQFNVSSNSVGILIFSFKEKDEINWNKIYFAKSNTGVSNIQFVVQKALNQI